MKMTCSLPPTQMPEGEVALRLAFYLLALPQASQTITVCLDKHHGESGGKVIFPIYEFLTAAGWTISEPGQKRSWLGTFSRGVQRLVMSASSRGGDVVATIGSKRIRAECKKGKLQRSPGNPENRLIHEAIGQLMTIEEVSDSDVLIVAVPRSVASQSQITWQTRPLMQRTGISLVLVGRDGTIEGMPDLTR